MAGRIFRPAALAAMRAAAVVARQRAAAQKTSTRWQAAQGVWLRPRLGLPLMADEPGFDEPRFESEGADQAAPIPPFTDEV